jgi:hypothetical protein
MFGREFCGAGGVELFFLEWSAAKHPLSTSSFFSNSAGELCAISLR